MSVVQPVRIIPLMAALVLAGASVPASAPASENGPARTMERKPAMQHEAGFIVRKGIEDDLTVVFHVMRAPVGMRYSKDQYHLMVIVERDGKPVPGLHLISRVKHPDGSTEQKVMKNVGDWHMAVYNLNHELGRHWITVEFARHGKNYSAGAYYPEWDFSPATRRNAP